MSAIAAAITPRPECFGAFLTVDNAQCKGCVYLQTCIDRSLASIAYKRHVNEPAEHPDGH